MTSDKPPTIQELRPLYSEEWYVYNVKLRLYWDPNKPKVLVHAYQPASSVHEEYVLTPPADCLPNTWPKAIATMFKQFMETSAIQELNNYKRAGGKLH